MRNHSYIPDDVIIFKKEVFFSDLLSTPANAYSTYDNFSMEDVENEVINISINYVVLRNIFMNAQFYMIANGTRILSGLEAYEQFKEAPILEYDEVIAIGHRTSYFFGHILKDIFTGLMLLPEEVVKTTPILCFQYVKYYKEFYDLMGWNKSLIVEIKDPWNNFYQIKKLHTIDYLHCKLLGAPYKNFSKILRQKLGIDNVVPTKYIIYNRPRNKYRYIANFNGFCKKIRKAFPDYTWETLTHDFTTIRETGLCWCHIKFIVGPTGSNFDHVVYMQPKGCTVAAVFQWFDFPIWLTHRALDISLVMWYEDKSHWRTKGFNPNWKYAHKAIEFGLKLVNGEKPDYKSYNLTLI